MKERDFTLGHGPDESEADLLMDQVVEAVLAGFQGKCQEVPPGREIHCLSFSQLNLADQTARFRATLLYIMLGKLIGDDLPDELIQAEAWESLKEGGGYADWILPTKNSSLAIIARRRKVANTDAEVAIRWDITLSIKKKPREA